MTYARLPTDTEYDDEAHWQRADRQPQPWVEPPDPRPTPQQLAADRRELATLEEGLAEAESECRRALGVGPAMEFLRWASVVDALKRDIAECRAALERWKE